MRETTEGLGARIGGQLYLAHRYARAATNAALREHGIELRHLGVLSALAEAGPMNQRALVDRLQLDKSSMVYIIDELERQGLAERRRDPHDRRSYLVHLTDTGRDRLDAATDAAAEVMDRLCEPLSGPERAGLSELLARFIGHAEGLNGPLS
ncbi:MarR family winged helix-turn-helix transcriptional regulator [Nocardia spumae]|uniref:MarR family winged helix-turn-helix transcriptional regulator n=1 Tax=Nocardia spumae TaxID=2887190 RepID=UPI001D14D71D|nr:MarR family transcriptional regulator [Nocardia spumae]